MRTSICVLIFAVTTVQCDQPPVIIKNYVNTETVTSVDNVTKVNQTAQLHSVVNTAQYALQEAGKQAQEYTYELLSWINQNRFKTAGYAALIGYGYTWYKLLSLNYALTQSENWSKWRETLTLEELLALPQQDITIDVLTAIQRQYTTPEQFDNLLGPLIAFMRDADTEIAQLKQLIQLHTWIDRLRISFLFPSQAELVKQAQHNIHRITYLKNLILNWMSHQKVARLSQS